MLTWILNCSIRRFVLMFSVLLILILSSYLVWRDAAQQAIEKLYQQDKANAEQSLLMQELRYSSVQIQQYLIGAMNADHAKAGELHVDDDIDRERQDRGKGQMMQPAASVIGRHLVTHQQGADQAQSCQQQEDGDGRMVLGGDEAGGGDVYHLVQGR